jgi:hypothetical protein
MEGTVMKHKRRSFYGLGSPALHSPLARALRAGDSRAQQEQGTMPHPPGYKYDASKPDRRKEKRV